MTTKENIDEAEKYYQRGNAYRQQSDWQNAIACYNEAIALNPDSPAAKAKEMIENILNYYCKEMFNP